MSTIKCLQMEPSDAMLSVGAEVVKSLEPTAGPLPGPQNFARLMWLKMWEAAEVMEKARPTGPPRDWFPLEQPAKDPVMETAHRLIIACVEHIRKVGSGSANADDQVYDGRLKYTIDVSVRGTFFVSTPLSDKD